MIRLTIRVDFADGTALGPGKVRLLELVAETGSIRKAALGMEMSYRQAWLLLKALDTTFGAPLTDTVTGGRAGGGAVLTSLGKLVVLRYRNLEKSTNRAAAWDLAVLAKRMTPENVPRTGHRTKPKALKQKRKKSKRNII